ncbi:UDP-N-acetylmuramate dehydrogenase [Pseudomonas sp. HK3]|jgi:UDP-N-acetylmuramate dehydrogenase
MNIQQNVSLQAFNTLGVHSYAQFMAQVSSVDEFKEVASFAKEEGLAIKVLGGGSNVVLPEAVSGLVVQFTGCQYHVLEENHDHVALRVEAGFNWHELVMFTLQQGWNGLQNLAYIPGLVGAAPVQNIGAYGVEVKEFIRVVHGVHLGSGQAFELTNDACQFEYRESIFKQALDSQTLITAVDFILSKSPVVNTSYAPLDQMAEDRGVPTPLELADWVIGVRKSKLPQPDELPNAGSFFKNPVINDAEFERLKNKFANMPHYKQTVGVKIPAGWLIDQMGFKGKAFGAVSVHKQQALVLINNGGSGGDVLAAAQAIKEAVFNEYGIALEQEPRLF